MSALCRLVRLGHCIGRRLRLEDPGALVQKTLEVKLVIRVIRDIVLNDHLLIIRREEDVGEEILNALVVDLGPILCNLIYPT